MRTKQDKPIPNELDEIQELRDENAKLRQELDERTDQAAKLADRLRDQQQQNYEPATEIPADNAENPALMFISAMIIVGCWFAAFRLGMIPTEGHEIAAAVFGLIGFGCVGGALKAQSDSVIVPKSVFTVVALLWAGELAWSGQDVLALVIALVTLVIDAAPLMEIGMEKLAQFLSNLMGGAKKK